MIFWRPRPLTPRERLDDIERRIIQAQERYAQTMRDAEARLVRVCVPLFEKRDRLLHESTEAFAAAPRSGESDA